jgi:hypothetical protein
MKIQKHAKVKIIFFFSAIFLVALSLMSYIRIKILLEANEVINQSKIAKFQLEKKYRDFY